MVNSLSTKLYQKSALGFILLVTEPSFCWLNYDELPSHEAKRKKILDNLDYILQIYMKLH